MNGTKYKSLSKLIIKNILDNKIVFLYTLGFPIAFFLYSNFDFITNKENLSLSTILMMLIPYWSYIIVTNVLNNVTIELIGYKENGFYKVISHITGSKWPLFFVVIFIQFFLTCIQLILSSILFMALLRSFHLEVFLYTLLIPLIVYVPVCFILNSLLLVNIKQQTFGILGTILIFTMFFLVNISSDSIYWSFLLTLNPLKYINSVSYFVLHPSTNYGIIFIISLIYFTIGSYSLKNFTINPYENRV